MKTGLLLLVLCTFQFKSYSQVDTIYFDKDSLKIEGIGVLSDTSKVGFWTFWHSNGIKASEGSYKLGKPHGYWKNWDTLGRFATNLNWKNGIKEGAVEAWNYEKNEYAVGSFKNNNIHGFMSLYSIEPKDKILTGYFKHGQMHGKWILYFPNGDKKSIVYYKEGKETGNLIIYNEDGSISVVKKRRGGVSENE